MPEQREGKPWSAKRMLVWLGIAMVAVPGLILGRACKSARDRAPHLDAAGEPRSASVVHTDRGDVLMLVDEVSTYARGRKYAFRISAVDATNGHLLARTVFRDNPAPTGCWTATDKRAWCERDGLLLLDTRSLWQVASVADLVNRAGVGVPLGHDWRIAGAHAYVPLDDGRFADIDAATAQLTVVPAMPPEASHSPLAELPGRCGLRPPRGLDLPPRMLDATEIENVQLDEQAPGDLLILTRTSLIESRALRQLSRVSATGEVKWTANVGGKCQLSFVEGSTLVIATHWAATRAIAIDLASGAERWRFRH